MKTDKPFRCQDKPPRAIKFRAWDREEKVMIDADSWYFSDEFEPFIDSVEKCMRRFDLMQYTGLLDKNGTEIYHKDIFKNDRASPFEIVFFDGSFRGHYGPTEPSLDSPGFHFDSYEAKKGEVLGNSLQHKHLLESENGEGRNSRVER